MEQRGGLDSPPLLYWGDSLAGITKQDKTIRIGFVNIRGFGASSTSAKNKQFAWFAQQYGFDVLGTAENNVNWKALPIGDRPFERSRGWWPL